MLIIIPGWKQNAELWEQVSELLTSVGVVNYVVDIPGFGTIPYNNSIADFSDLAEWCEQNIKSVAAGSNFSLLGHSCGGRVAVDLVGRGKLQVDALILSGSPNVYRPSVRVKIISAIATLSRPVHALFPESFRKKFRSDDYENVKDTDMSQLYQSVYKHDQSALLKSISNKTLLVWGENDNDAPIKLMYEIQNMITNSTSEIIKGTGHNIHLEKPQLLAAKIQTFLDEKST